MRMRLSARPDDSRAVPTAGGAAGDVGAEDNERGAWGEGRTHLVYRGWLPRYTLTLDATPDALVYRRRDRRYPNGTYACTYRWCDVVHTNYTISCVGEPLFNLHLWLPAAADAPTDLPPGGCPAHWEDADLPATRAVVDLVNRRTPHLPYIWVPVAGGGYAKHDRSAAITPDWEQAPRTRVGRWVREETWYR